MSGTATVRPIASTGVTNHHRVQLHLVDLDNSDVFIQVLMMLVVLVIMMMVLVMMMTKIMVVTIQMSTFRH